MWTSVKILLSSCAICRKECSNRRRILLSHLEKEKFVSELLKIGALTITVWKKGRNSTSSSFKKFSWKILKIRSPAIDTLITFLASIRNHSKKLKKLKKDHRKRKKILVSGSILIQSAKKCSNKFKRKVLEDS